MSAINIFQRINKVMQAVAYVQKDKQVSGGGQNYKAVTHDQVVSVAREELVKNGVVIYPEQLKSEMLITRNIKQDIKMHLYSADYAIHFVNIDKPDDRMTITINSHAADNGDKAPGKAVTYATKAAILKALMLESGEDEESRAEARAIICEEDLVKIQHMIDKLGLTEDSFTRKYSIASLKELPDRYTSLLIDDLSAGIKALEEGEKLVTGTLQAIVDATTEKDLKASFGAAYKSLQKIGFADGLKSIKAAYDAKLKELTK